MPTTRLPNPGCCSRMSGGQALGARRRWVAVPPPRPRAKANGRPEPPYTGPPSYPAPPRWGFPAVTWRWPTTVPGTVTDRVDPVRRQRVVGGRVLLALIVTTGLALLAASAELWRYALLVQSRNASLNTATVLFSDALVVSASALLVVSGAITIVVAFLWLLHARAAAAVVSETQPPRTPWRIAAGLFVPGFNWVLAGPIAAELEHLASGRPAGKRPRLSRLVLAWWVVWVSNGVLLTVTVAWRLRDEVQAQADSVLLTGITNIAAAALAVLTALLVQRIRSLLLPIVPERLRGRWVTAVRDAPDPELRPQRVPAASR